MTTRKVSTSQLELLIEFMENHHSLALGRVRGKEGNALSQRLWRKCAENLNADIGGAIKPAQEWKKYYNHYKSRVKTKARGIKEGIKGTGGGPAQLNYLTPLEERLYAVLGGCSSPLPVRQNPLPVLSDPIPSTSTSTRDIVALPEHDDDGNEQVDPAHLCYVIAIENDGTEISEEPLLEEAIVDQSAMIPENEEMEMPQEQEELTERRREPTERQRPRKRRSQRSSSPQKMNAFQEAGQQLAAMEAERVEVSRQLACATNRQAAALEEFVGQVKRFVDLYAQQIQYENAMPQSPFAAASTTPRQGNDFGPSSEYLAEGKNNKD